MKFNDPDKGQEFVDPDKIKGNFLWHPNQQGLGEDRTIPQLAEDARQSGGANPLAHAAKSLVGAGETALAMGTELPAIAVGGIETAARLPFQGAKKAIEEGEKTASTLSYSPRTDYGQ